MMCNVTCGPWRAQCWAFANMSYEPGEPFWHAVGLNTINHVHEYSAQNIANGGHRSLNIPGACVASWLSRAQPSDRRRVL